VPLQHKLIGFYNPDEKYLLAQVAVCSHINTKHINTVCVAERTVVEY
jgi:hypothetical protein